MAKKFVAARKADKGDVLRGNYFHKVGGKQVCIAWNRGEAGNECADTCPNNRLHVCSYCKGGHRSRDCAKAKKDGHA